MRKPPCGGGAVRESPPIYACRFDPHGDIQFSKIKKVIVLGHSRAAAATENPYDRMGKPQRLPVEPRQLTHAGERSNDDEGGWLGGEAAHL